MESRSSRSIEEKNAELLFDPWKKRVLCSCLRQREGGRGREMSPPHLKRGLLKVD